MLNRTFTFTELGKNQNHNKYWKITCDDNGEVITKWGRVGLGEQSKNFGNQGERFALKKIAEKIEKGYEEQAFVVSGVKQIERVSGLDVFDGISSDPFVVGFIKRISVTNRHKILETTTLTYNSNGLYQTPLGIVTPEGITKARDILASATRYVRTGDGDLAEITSKYLRIIPHNIRMKADLSILATEEKIKQELTILDMLLSSYEHTMSNPAEKEKEIERKPLIFSLINNSDDAERLEKIYFQSRSKHHTDRMKYKVANIYKCELPYIPSVHDDNTIEVFHGTGEGNLLSILINGLKTSPPSTAYIAGKMFGNGIYGAINSTKSLGYTNISHSESGWLFVCDFAMGKYYCPKYSYNGPPNGYDSTWAKACDTSLLHDELIVYKNERAKIKYLLEIK